MHTVVLVTLYIGSAVLFLGAFLMMLLAGNCIPHGDEAARIRLLMEQKLGGRMALAFILVAGLIILTFVTGLYQGRVGYDGFSGFVEVASCFVLLAALVKGPYCRLMQKGIDLIDKNEGEGSV